MRKQRNNPNQKVRRNPQKKLNEIVASNLSQFKGMFMWNLKELRTTRNLVETISA